MQFGIADTFTDSLGRLTGDEQKLVKTTAFDLQVNPDQHGMGFHKIDQARDKNFWSVRVSRDIRIIVHKTSDSLLLCYVDHHDPAYRWAERRRLETHPKTGAAQLVEIRETVQEIFVPQPADALPARTHLPLLVRASDDELLNYGVPPEWLNDVRQADEDSILKVASHLPSEAAEAVLSLAVGVVPPAPAAAVTDTAPFEHPDAKRRFRLVSDMEELERALDFPWDKWTIFLHPAQREWVEGDYGGPARVAGSAGTGKTVVALHRAAFLARSNADARVLLTTFSDALANRLRTQMRRLISHEPRLGERVEVHSIDTIGRRLYELNLGKLRLAAPEDIRSAITTVMEQQEAQRFSRQFLMAEWQQVVDAWQLASWEEYRDVDRLGRKTRLPEQQRRVLWSIFEHVRAAISAQGMVTGSEMYTRLATWFLDKGHLPFEFVVVDEAQDVNVAQMKFLAALGAGRRNGLFFAGDLGQRIFQQPFSWRSLGVDVRGRSRILRVNYRTSHQIRSQADQLLDPEVSDVDGNIESRKGTVSLFNGPEPEIVAYGDANTEIGAVGQWLAARAKEGVHPEEMAVFVRSVSELGRARDAVSGAGLECQVLDDSLASVSRRVSVSTMHLAKGLEFRAVAVMACDDEVVPSQKRIETVGDEADLQDVYDTERQLLYVACTRARDHLLVTSGGPPSEFLEDLRSRVA